MTTSTKLISRTLLDKETDARFWAQTGYRVGHKLDLSDPTDRAMAKVWADVFRKVKAEDDAGRLIVTYDHPAVDRHLGDAALAAHAVDASLDAAAQTPDPEASRRHVEAAASAAQTASQSTQAAASYQPATVSPIVTLAAAQEVAHGAGLPPPPAVMHELPPGHPAHSPAARPALSPEMVSAPVSHADPTPDHPTHTYVHPDGSSVVTYDHEIHGPHAAPDQVHVHARADRRRRHREQLAIAHAIAAPTVAIAVHEAEHGRASAGVPSPASTISSQTFAQLRDRASLMVRSADAGADVVGVIATPAGEWSALTFPSATEAADWYGATHDRGGFAYLAYFDRHDAAWPGPVNEDVSGGSIEVAVQVDRPPADREERSTARAGTDYTKIAVIGAIATGTLLALAAMSQRRQ